MSDFNVIKKIAGYFNRRSIVRDSIPDDLTLLGKQVHDLSLKSAVVRAGREPEFFTKVTERHEPGFYVISNGALKASVFLMPTSDHRLVLIEFRGEETVKVNNVYYRRVVEVGGRYYHTTLMEVKLTQEEATVLLDSAFNFMLDNNPHEY